VAGYRNRTATIAIDTTITIDTITIELTVGLGGAILVVANNDREVLDGLALFGSIGRHGRRGCVPGRTDACSISWQNGD
jgi:hypothetical protein